MKAKMNSMEELESLDIPRGVVKAANLHAAKEVPLADSMELIQAMTPEQQQSTLKLHQALYKLHFDSFIAGAKWTDALVRNEKPVVSQ